jgi:hypothetical protein
MSIDNIKLPVTSSIPVNIVFSSVDNNLPVTSSIPVVAGREAFKTAMQSRHHRRMQVNRTWIFFFLRIFFSQNNNQID